MKLLAAALLVLGTAAASAAELSVTFPDGEVIRVDIRRAPAPMRVDKKSTRMVQLYPTLREKANAGDAAAAFELSKLLRDCSSAPGTQQELDAAMDRLLESGVGDSAAQRAEEMLLEPYRFCLGLSAAQKSEDFDWLLKAARIGHPLAMTREASTMGTSNAALRLHEAAWRAGYLPAATQLGRLHLRGRIGEREPDPVRSLAYYYVYDRLISMSVTRLGAQSREWAETRMAEAEPDIRIAAMAMAKQLLRENPNCCYLR